MWFKQLTGFNEESVENVKNKIEVNGKELHSLVNSSKIVFGELEIPTLDELKKQTQGFENYNGKIQVKEIVANVQELHSKIENLLLIV